MAGGKTSATKVKLAQRRQRVMVLRKAGATLRGIAQAIVNEFPDDFPNYTDSQAAKDIKYILDELNDLSLEDAESMRRLHSERLDMALLAIANQVRVGDLHAIDRWIKTIETSAKLWGLNLPPVDRAPSETTTSEIELRLILPEP